MKQLKCYSLCFSLAGLLSVSIPATAADKSCDAVNKSGELGLKQARIQYATDFMRPAAPKPNDKSPALGEKMMQAITIDKTNYMAMDGLTFDTQALKTDGERSLMSGLALFAMVDEGCKSLGKTTVAGRSAVAFEQGANKTSDDRYYKFWIDAQTGLPVKGLEDAPLPEIQSFKVTKDGRPKIEAKLNKNERVLNTMGFIFGDMVKPPKLNGAKGLFGQKGEVDPAATAMLKAIVVSKP